MNRSQTVQARYHAILNDPLLAWPKVIEFAVRDRYAPDEETAWRHLPAFVQWLATRTIADPDLFVMLSGPEDKVLYHPFMIGSTRRFRYFRKKYMNGEEFDHEAILASDGPISGKKMGAAVRYSVELLEECFGDQLDDSLKSWRRQFDSGIWSVDGCGGHACHSKVDVAA